MHPLSFWIRNCSMFNFLEPLIQLSVVVFWCDTPIYWKLTFSQTSSNYINIILFLQIWCFTKKYFQPDKPQYLLWVELILSKNTNNNKNLWIFGYNLFATYRKLIVKSVHAGNSCTAESIKPAQPVVFVVMNFGADNSQPKCPITH